MEARWLTAGGEVVAFAITERTGGRGRGAYVYVHELHVRPGWRERGLARRLLQEAAGEAAAAQRGETLAAMELEVHDDNSDAQAAYVRMGFGRAREAAARGVQRWRREAS